MPSHNIHKFCAFLIGLPEDVASHVDIVIDSGTCFVHDVGLEDAVTFINEEACIVFGVHATIYCLYRDEKLGEDSLKALALHMLLDCIDRKAESSHGSEHAFQRCLNFIENRVRVAMSTDPPPRSKGRGFLLLRGGLGLHPLFPRVQSRAGSPAHYPYPSRDSGL